jgi:MFS family permease
VLGLLHLMAGHAQYEIRYAVIVTDGAGTAAQRVPRGLYVVALCVGIAHANASLAIPLMVLAQHHSSTTAGALLATITACTALGAAISPPLRDRLGRAPSLLVLALVLVASGHLVLTVGLAPAELAVGAGLVGLGVGIFWVASQVLLAAHSGSAGSENGFLRHFGFFTAGTMLGATATGLAATLLEHTGLSTATSLRLAAGVGILSAFTGLVVWRPAGSSLEAAPGEPVAAPGRLVAHGLTMQLPDLLLVAALAFLSPVIPIVLTNTFHFSSVAVGVVMAGIGLAKVVGTVVARALVTARGSTWTILGMLGSGTGFCLLLTVTVAWWLFVPTVLLAVLVLAGAWPLVVDACQARTALAARGAFAAAWNIREYGVIALSTAGASWMYGTAGSATPMFMLGAALLVGAVLSAAAMMRKPIAAPACVSPA